MSPLFESHQLSEMFFTSEKRPRVQGLQLKLVPSYTIAETHTHSHRCKCTCSHTFLKTPNSFSSSLSTNLRNYSPIRTIKTPSTPHTHKARTHTLIMSSLQSVCASVCVCFSILSPQPSVGEWYRRGFLEPLCSVAASPAAFSWAAAALPLPAARGNEHCKVSGECQHVRRGEERGSKRGWKQKRRGRERLWSRGPPGRPSSASPPTRWIQRTTSRVGSFFLISNASPVCVRVSVCERHWHSERGWQSPGLGDEACVAAAIDLLVSVVQSAAGAPWLTCLETNDGECTDFMLWGILTLSDCFCFWIEAHSRLSSCRRCVCVHACMGVCL